MGESEADGGRRFSTLHCTGVMRSGERGKRRSGGGEDEKQDKALRLAREASRHTSGRRRMWSVVCGAAAGGEFGAAAGLLGDKGRYPRLDALTCICLCCPPSQREPVLLAAACLN